jgi:hypothetical protein
LTEKRISHRFSIFSRGCNQHKSFHLIITSQSKQKKTNKKNMKLLEIIRSMERVLENQLFAPPLKGVIDFLRTL